MPVPIDLARRKVQHHRLRSRLVAASPTNTMDTPLTGERLGEEKAFARRYLDQLSHRPVNYAADYSPPLSTRPRKVGVVHTEVRPPPEAMDVDAPQGEISGFRVADL